MKERVPTFTPSDGRPEVIVEILFERGLLFVSVRNIGNRPAVTVSVTFRRKLLGLNGTRDVSSQALFRNIEFLGPGREIVTFLDSSSSYFRRRQPTKLVAKVAYGDLNGRQYAVIIKHDLEIYRDLVFVETSKADPEESGRVP
jgi:hypothetical protein